MKKLLLLLINCIGLIKSPLGQSAELKDIFNTPASDQLVECISHPSLGSIVMTARLARKELANYIAAAKSDLLASKQKETIGYACRRWSETI